MPHDARADSVEQQRTREERSQQCAVSVPHCCGAPAERCATKARRRASSTANTGQRTPGRTSKRERLTRLPRRESAAGVYGTVKR